MKNKRGISLIILIITIIVVIILASVVILAISKNNPLNSAKEANFKSDVRNFQDDLAIYVGNQILTDYNGTREKITTSENPNVDEIKNYIASFTKKYEGKLGIEEDELVYFPKGVTKEEKKWLEDLGIKAKALKATDESEFNWKSNDPNNSEYGTITSYKGTSVNVVIPERCTEIKLFSFNFNSNIESITLTKNVSFLDGSFIYWGCNSLVSIEVVEDNPYFSSIGGVLFSKDMTKLIRYPQGNKNIEYTIPDNVNTIGNYAFYYCNNLKNIVIPNTVKTIDEQAISLCNGLNVINIPDSVTNIELGMNNGNNFNCENVTEINVSENNKYYSSRDGVLFNKSQNKIIRFPLGKNDNIYEIPSSVNNIAEHAFENCRNIETIIIPNSVNSIGHHSFNQCSNLKNINIPDSVKSIDWKAFQYCKSLIIVNVPNGIESIPMECFSGCSSLETVILPNSLKSIGDYSFENCKNLSNITLPENLKTIGYRTFWQCDNLNKIIIPKSVTKIGYGGLDSSNLIIYCRITEEEKPSGWSSEFTGRTNKINWGYEGE